MSLGAGHVWATRGVASSTCVDVIICEHCYQSRLARTVKLKRIRHKPKHGKRYEFTSPRFFGGRPLGTCSALMRKAAF